jgi:flagellar basal-body rod protein FlgC
LPLSDIFGIASTALNAQRVRMNLTASNLANAGTSASSEGEAFRAKRPVFQALVDAAHLDAGSPYQGGVKVKKVVDDGAIIPRVFDPHHPLADKDGYTYRSNVNEVTEMVEMMEAARSYQNNVEVINTARDLTMRTVDALKS